MRPAFEQVRVAGAEVVSTRRMRLGNTPTSEWTHLLLPVTSSRRSSNHVVAGLCNSVLHCGMSINENAAQSMIGVQLRFFVIEAAAAVGQCSLKTRSETTRID